MLSLLICCIVGYVVGYLVYRRAIKNYLAGSPYRYQETRSRDDRYAPDAVSYGMWGALILGIVGSLTIAIAYIPFQEDPGRGEHSWNIVASNDGTNLNGQWGIFGGSIDSKPVYKYYYRTSNGGYKQSWVPAAKSTIYEDVEPGGQAYITKSWNEDLNTRGWLVFDLDVANEENEKRYAIHVPPGSLRQEHVYDLND